MRSIEEIREIFAADRFATENGAVVDAVGEGSATCSLTLTARHRNAAGGVMGGVPFMLADFAFAVAANHQTMRTVSISSNIALVGAAKGERLVATARCVKDGRSTCFYLVEVTDELGTKVEEVSVTGFHKA